MSKEKALLWFLPQECLFFVLTVGSAVAVDDLLLPFFDRAYQHGGLPQALEEAHRSRGVLLAHDDDIADAHVEDPVHLIMIDFALSLDEREDGRSLPAVAVDDGIAVRGQNPRDVVHEPTARDVSHPADRQFGHQR